MQENLPWSNPSSDPLGDLRNAKKLMERQHLRLVENERVIEETETVMAEKPKVNIDKAMAEKPAYLRTVDPETVKKRRSKNKAARKARRKSR